MLHVVGLRQEGRHGAADRCLLIVDGHTGGVCRLKNTGRAEEEALR
ncbi:hypothetical protein [Streptosporangium sp. CA-115845]